MAFGSRHIVRITRELRPNGAASRWASRLRPGVVFRGRTGVAILGILGVNALLSVSLAWPAVLETPMAIFAHRGDVAHWPENSREAILAASRAPIDGIEFDVRRSADGTWWLAHDRELGVISTGGGPIGRASDSELAGLRAAGGFGFDAKRHGNVRLVRLDTILDDLAAYQGTLIVDVKEGTADAHTAIAGVLVARGRPGSYVICRSVEGATAVKAIDSRLTTILLSDFVGHPDVDVWLLDANGQVKWPRTTFTDAAGTLGMVFISKVDERAALENGHRWGVSFVISNDIGRSLAWRDGISSLATK
jgi:glycerophosphoryl diester phosphodiesterase